MKNITTFLFFVVFVFFTAAIHAQDIPVKPKSVITGQFVGISQPLKDIPPMSKEDYLLMQEKARKKGKNTKWTPPTYEFAATALPKGPDEAWQKSNGAKSTGSRAPLQNFEGQSSPYYPPDCNGTAGPSHYMQTVNTTYAIYSKTGTLLAGPTNMNLLFGSVTGATNNDGDPLILYDEQANRWVAVEFSVSGTNDYMLIAVSTTNDPTGTWYQYSFDVVDMPDYEKMAVWRDGYYMGTNTQPTTGNDIYVFERDQMLVGGVARMVAFDNPYRPGTGVVVVPPVDNDGPAAPAGTPGTFIAFNDDGIGGGADELWLYELDVDWTNTANSTFNRTQQLAVTPFDSQFSNGWDNLPQPGTTMKLCAISTVIMNVPQYRNFGTHESIVCCHTVDVDGTDHAGVRWYELRRTAPATTWTIRQQGTYAPDNHSRWMGSISMNGSGKIGVGYSLTSSTEYPGIRYAGQSSAGYASASGILDVPETIALTGTNFQYTYNRWGDYSSMAIDPVDDQTFWFTTQYIGASEARKTKIISFNIGDNPIVSTLPASAINGTTATLNGTVNPNGLATTYYFQWGTTTAYGSTTTVTSAGSGSSAASVTANLTGLTLNTTYHFRIVATNSDGTSYGSDLTFIAGGATLTTTAASAITLTTATSGGNITATGGSAITARGVCWATTANPTTANSHTTDGTGTGSFSSSITGLSASTLYHVRAYATNGYGTFYGDDQTFTTLCGVYSLPFTQNFDNTTIPTCWTQVDNQGNGQIWQFGTITGQSPNPALTGNYAYLNSDGYGSSGTQNADLVTPTLDLSLFTNVTLQFNHYFKSYSGSSGTLSYSINNGGSWTSISTFTTTSATNPASFSQVIAAVAGQANVKFKWNYTGAYGYYWGIDNISITGTLASIPAVTTTAASAIASTTATSGGNVTSAGASSVTARGICWSTSANPTISGSHTTDGSGTGTFVSSLTGLTANTTYHIRAYATNTSGTAYGDDLTFTTTGAAVVTTTSATSITLTSATSGGNVTSDGGSAVTARGVCWATTANPTLANSYTTDGSGTGTFTSSITGLSASTIYHYRAYATNANGTFYGSDLTFTTGCGGVSSFPWSEGFENAGAIPACWTQEQINSSGVNWVFITGNGTGYPSTAHGGTYDACLKDATAADNKTRLIAPALNLSALPSPQLKFWHTQTFWSPDQDVLTVYYKTSAAGTWTQLATYTSSVTTWTERTLSLPSPSADYYICFEGNAKYGRGVCVDDVSVSTSCASIDPVSVSLSASATSVCAGTSVTFTATPTNGGTTPAYQWKVNGGNVGTNSATYAYAPNNNDVVSCVLTSNASCVSGNPATSTPITMTVNPVLPVSISTSPSANNVCAGTSVSFTATPTYGGTTPAYQWKVNGGNIGTNSATYAYTPTNNDVVTCVLTSNASCVSGNPATSTPITMTVNPVLPVSISTSPSANNVCAGTSVSFTATPTNGGTTPAYQWKVNGGNVGTNSATYAYAPNNNDVVSCVLTSNASCVSGNPATSTPITMTVNPVLPVSIVASPSANGICAGSSVIFTAIPTNGGNSPSYQWKVNGSDAGTNSASHTYIPTNNDVVSCVLTSNASCVSGNPATSSPITMTVNPLMPVSISIEASANPVVSGTMVTFTASPINGGTSPVYQWKRNGSNVGSNSAEYSYIPSNGDEIHCELTSSIGCPTGNPASSAPITMTVTSASTALSITVLVEGLFNGTELNKSQGSTGDQFSEDTSDEVIIELHSASAPYALVGSPILGNLRTSGQVEVSVPGAYNGSYYLVFKHRNSLETWSNLPLVFGSGALSYDFTDFKTRAYGENLKLVSGKYVVYSGDINQDGVINDLDMIAIKNEATSFSKGYIPEDVNGDGTVDALDLIITDNNASYEATVLKP